MYENNWQSKRLLAFITLFVVMCVTLFSASGFALRVSKDAAAAALASHRALYDFKTVSIESGARMTGVRGQMYYDQSDACEAYTTDQRFTTEYHYPERPTVLNTSHFNSWEAKDGRQFQFNSERQENAVMIEQLRGGIERVEDGSVKAVYTRPEGQSFDLPNDYFLPIAHTLELIRAARAGRKIFNAVVFDGTDADGPVEINAFIGKKLSFDDIASFIPKTAKIDKNLLDPDAWEVHMAIFPLQGSIDGVPSYEMNIVLHGNGVVSHALVDYGSFEVEQSLMALEPIKSIACP